MGIDEVIARLGREAKAREGVKYVGDDGVTRWVDRTSIPAAVSGGYTGPELDNLKLYAAGTSHTMPEDYIQEGVNKQVVDDAEIIRMMKNPPASKRRSSTSPSSYEYKKDLENTPPSVLNKLIKTQASLKEFPTETVEDVNDPLYALADKDDPVPQEDLDNLSDARDYRDSLRESAQYDMGKAKDNIETILDEDIPLKEEDMPKGDESRDPASDDEEDLPSLESIEEYDDDDEEDLPTLVPIDAEEPPESVSGRVGESFVRGAENVGSVGGSILESLIGFGTGGVQGATGAFGDELAAAAMAAGDYVTGEEGDYSDLYKKRHEQTQEFVDQQLEDNPVSYRVGEIGTGVGVGLMTGGASTGLRGATAAARALGSAKVGGVAGLMYGAGESKGKLIGSTEEERDKLYGDTAFGGLSGVALGGLGDLAITGAGKVLKPTIGRLGTYIGNKLKKTNFARAQKQIHKWGEEKLKPASASSAEETKELIGSGVSKKTAENQIINDTTHLTVGFKNADDLVAQRVGDSVENGFQIGGELVPEEIIDKAGKKIPSGKMVPQKAIIDIHRWIDDAGKEARQGMERLKPKKIIVDGIETDVPLNFSDMTDAQKAAHQYADYLSHFAGSKHPIFDDIDYPLDQTVYNAEQVKAMMGELSGLWHKFKEYPAITGSISKLRKRLDDHLRANVVGYDDAMKGMHQFRVNVQDNIKNQAAVDNFRRYRFSDAERSTRYADLVVALDKNVLDHLTMGKQKTGEPIVENLINYLETVKDDPELMKALNTGLNGVEFPPSVLSFIERLYGTADKKHALQLLGSHVAMNPMRGTPHGAIAEQLAGSGPVAYLSKANQIIGRKKDIVRKNPYYKAGKAVFLQPDDFLTDIAKKMESREGALFKSIGKRLREAVENNDRNGINAALFVAMQNPNLRGLIGEESYD